jgi:hypothetical protein
VYGPGSFTPLVLDLILGKTADINWLVGTDEEFATKDALHDIALGKRVVEGKTYVIADIQLFCRYGAPRYHVVVGEALEPAR